MQLATPQALAAMLKLDKASVVSDWEAHAAQMAGASRLSAPALRDHLPLLIDELVKDLEHPHQSSELSHASSIHGSDRLKTGMDLPQIVEEYKLLRLCIVQHAERIGLDITREANRVMDELIDDGIRNAVKTYVALRDETERKQREDYLTFVVHDLRAPLTAIYNAILLIELELRNAPISDRARAIPAAIKRNIERMQALMVKLLQAEQTRVAPSSRVPRTAVELRPIVESVVRTLAPSAAAHATCVTNEISPDAIIRADAGMLERVFQNLVNNAIAYTPGGSVTVGAAGAADGSVECWVADNGRGIPADLKERVFDKYLTDRSHEGGVGLGLAIVKRLVEAHGGKIHIDSQEGAGTTVRFHIPGV